MRTEPSVVTVAATSTDASRSNARVLEVPLSWQPGCDDHPETFTLRLEMEWLGVRDGKKAMWAHHVDVCEACLRPIPQNP